MKQKPDISGQKSLAHGQYRYIESFISLGSKEQVQRIPRETYSILASPPDFLRDSSRVPPPLACVPGARKGKEERKIRRACFDVCALHKRSTYCRIRRDETFCFRSIPFKPMNQTYLRRSLGIDIIFTFLSALF